MDLEFDGVCRGAGAEDQGWGKGRWGRSVQTPLTPAGNAASALSGSRPRLAMRPRRG